MNKAAFTRANKICLSVFNLGLFIVCMCQYFSMYKSPVYAITFDDFNYCSFSAKFISKDEVGIILDKCLNNVNSFLDGLFIHTYDQMFVL